MTTSVILLLLVFTLGPVILWKIRSVRSQASSWKQLPADFYGCILLLAALGFGLFQAVLSPGMAVLVG